MSIPLSWAPGIIGVCSEPPDQRGLAHTSPPHQDHLGFIERTFLAAQVLEIIRDDRRRLFGMGKDLRRHRQGILGEIQPVEVLQLANLDRKRYQLAVMDYRARSRRSAPISGGR